MEYKLILSIIKKYKSGNILCWDIQVFINFLKNILIFNKTINNTTNEKYYTTSPDISKYYNYDIIFLLQNDYFFTKKQIEKYFEMRDDIIKNNANLKLHQIMMGKGKTSVITPLLSLVIHYMTPKIPTIITTFNLEDQTKKIINLNDFLLKYCLIFIMLLFLIY